MFKKILFLSAILITTQNYGQKAIPVGAGSYAEYTPLYKSRTAERNGDQSRLMETRKLYITETSKHLPVPTNDWWTDLIISQYSGNLWAYPQVVKAESYGFSVAFPKTWTTDGREMKWNTQLNIGAQKFKPESACANRWHDWGFDFEMKDGEKEMLVTVAHGIPFTWVETKNIVLQIQFKDAKFSNENGAINFPFTGKQMLIEQGNDAYGIYAPDGSIFTLKENYLEIKFSGNKQFLSIGVLPNSSALTAFSQYAYVIPRNTEVTWNYNEAAGKVSTQWKVLTENLNGEAEKNVLQGFIPHHYKKSELDFVFSNFEYATPRGKMKMAAGNTFNISYTFNGVLPFYPAPKDNETLKNPYRNERMKQMIAEYADKGGFGADTYWGGKGLTQMALYMTFAHEMGETELFEKCKSRLKEVLENWLTYVPGEQNFFFARYNRWGALVGYNTSYDSETFNDHHFHYGYFTYAASLLAMHDEDFRKNFGQMATLVAKDYANWDKTDTDFPFFRTLDPWAGHSYAGGLGGWAGNGQESSSEAMQGWGGMYLLGVATNNKAMRDAGIFGWVSESRATAEYWFDRDRENIDYSRYDKPYNSNLTSQGIGWWTWFSGDPAWMHSIQWMPISPIMKYLYEDIDFAEWEYTQMWNSKEVGSWSTQPNVSSSLSNESGLGNVVLSYLQIFNPDSAASVFDNMWNAQKPIARNPDTGGISYFITHSHRTYGDICWDIHANVPTVTTYRNKQNGKLTHVVYNEDWNEKHVKFYQNGQEILNIKVPPRKLTVYSETPKLQKIIVQQAQKVVEPGQSVQLEAVLLDQYGATMQGNISWTASGQGTISSSGLFSASENKGFAIITATSGTISASTQLRIDEKPILKAATLLPNQQYLEAGKKLHFKLQMTDQYDEEYFEKNDWKIKKGDELLKNDSLFDFTEIGIYTIEATAANQTFSHSIFVSPAFSNIALNKTAITSSEENIGTPARFATDGNMTTRWGSTHSNPQWIYVNLGAISYISHINLVWETAYSSLYDIQVSDNAQNWTTVKTIHGTGKSEKTDINLSAQYIRILGKERATNYGHSLYEFEVYGIPPMGTEPVLFGIDITPREAVIKEGESITLIAKAYNQFGNAMDIQPVFSILSGEGNINAQGVFTPTKYGNAIVQAKAGDYTAKATFWVEESIKLNKINISPQKVSLIKGQSVQFKSEAFDQFGAAFNNNEIEYKLLSNNTILHNATFVGNETGTYRIEASVNNSIIKDTAIVEVRELDETNLALGKPVYASSVENDGTLTRYINDGDMQTRWSSAFSEPEWIMIDLKEAFVINKIKLYWQTSFASEYKIETSTDEENWKEVHVEKNGNGGNNQIEIQPTAAQYIKLTSLKRNSVYGASLWEIEVFGNSFWANAEPTDILISPWPIMSYIGKSINLETRIIDQYGLEYEQSEAIIWSVDGGGEIDANGVFTANRTGEYTLTVQYGSLKKEFKIQVLEAQEIAKIEITPAYITLKKNEQFRFSARVTDQFGNEMHESVTWSCDGGTIEQNGVFSAGNTGNYEIQATINNISAKATAEVTEAFSTNLALRKTATSSSGTASAAVDGNTGTRWESIFSDGPEWLMVDLGDAHLITDAEIVWETASASNYELQISKDGINWTNLKTASGLNGSRTDSWRTNGIGRYVRIWCTKRASVYGYSVWEFRLYGRALLAGEPYKISITSSKTVVETNERIILNAFVTDKHNDPTEVENLTWSATNGAINEKGEFFSIFSGITNVKATLKNTSGELELMIVDKTSLISDNQSDTDILVHYAENKLFVKADNIQQIKVMDILGRIIISENNPETRVYSMPEMPEKSFIIVSIHTGRKTATHKIMIQK